MRREGLRYQRHRWIAVSMLAVADAEVSRQPLEVSCAVFVFAMLRDV